MTQVLTKGWGLSQKLREYLPTVYERYGPLNARQYAYRAEVEKIIAKKDFDRVDEILVELRECNVIPWSGVLDASRDFDPYLVSNSGNPESYVKYAMEQFRGLPDNFDLPLWQNQPIIPVIFSEKEGLIPYFEIVTKRRAVSIYAQKGQVGKSHLHEVVIPWINELIEEEGRKIQILYLGDSDDEGYQIPLTLVETMEKWGFTVEYNTHDLFAIGTSEVYNNGANIRFRRLALKPPQVESMGLPTVEVNQKSSIANKFVESKCELEAMEPDVLRGIIEGAIDEYWNEDAEQERVKKAKEMRESIEDWITELSKGWPT